MLALEADWLRESQARIGTECEPGLAGRMEGAAQEVHEAHEAQTVWIRILDD